MRLRQPCNRPCASRKGKGRARPGLEAAQAGGGPGCLGDSGFAASWLAAGSRNSLRTTRRVPAGSGPPRSPVPRPGPLCPAHRRSPAWRSPARGSAPPGGQRFLGGRVAGGASESGQVGGRAAPSTHLSRRTHLSFQRRDPSAASLPGLLSS